MSVSMRSTKAQMYSEIERLRALCDWQAQQLRAASQPRAQHQAPEILERRAKLEALKGFATKFKCTARLRDGVIELYSRKRKCWVTVPEGAQP
jgi:hypothetical protein